MKLPCLLLALIVCSPLWAAVAHDGEANQLNATSSTVASLSTASQKTTAGSNRYGVCGVFASPAVAATATWAGNAMTEVAHLANPTDGTQAILFGIIDPPTGASTVTANFSPDSAGPIIVCSSYNGVDTTGTPVDAEVTASGTADPATLDVASASGDMVVDFLLFLGAGTPPSVGAGQTQNSNTDNGGRFGASSREAGAGGNTTMSWTLTSTTRWTQVAANMNQLAAGGGATIPIIMHNRRQRSH